MAIYNVKWKWKNIVAIKAKSKYDKLGKENAILIDYMKYKLFTYIRYIKGNNKLGFMGGRTTKEWKGDWIQKGKRND